MSLPDPANFRKIGEKCQRNRNSKKEEQKSESTEDHIKQISAQNDFPYKQKLPNHAHKVR
jgi:hypothetical protein